MTFDNFAAFLKLWLDAGYVFRTHLDHVRGEKEADKCVLLRHDVDNDRQMRGIRRLIGIEAELGVVSTVFVRLHDPDYNLLGFHELKVAQEILACGCELGLHAETLDLAEAMGQGHSPEEWLRRDLAVLRAATGSPVLGVAAHGDITGNNNLDLFHSLDLTAFGLVYHAYDQASGLFSGDYVSNFAGDNWKHLCDGQLVETGKRGFMDYARMMIQNEVRKLIFLVHSRPWHETGGHYLVN